MAKPSSTLENFSSSAESAHAAALSAHVSDLMKGSASSSKSLADQPQTLTFDHDNIYKGQNAQSIDKNLVGTPADKIHFTTPAQDAKSGTQPNYYLNAQGKLEANPKAKANKDGSINIEVEGNNSAKKAEDYANKLQKDAVKDLVAMYKAAHPGEKVPEMWQSILDATPDSNYPNTGDNQNNNTVTPAEQSAYDNSQAYDATPPPESSAATQDTYSPSSYDNNGGSSPGGDPAGASEGGDGGSSATSSLPNAATSDGGASTANLQQSSGTVANYDGSTADMSSTQGKIIAEADKDVGSAMWGGWSKDGATGVEGCAASVSQVLDNAGVANLHNAQDDNVNGMQADLIAQGWTVTSTPQPGDVWVGRGGASSGHTGIVGENNTLLDNDSSSGKFSKDELSLANSWTNSVFLKPPATTKA